MRNEIELIVIAKRKERKKSRILGWNSGLLDFWIISIVLCRVDMWKRWEIASISTFNRENRDCFYFAHENTRISLFVIIFCSIHMLCYCYESLSSRDIKSRQRNGFNIHQTSTKKITNNFWVRFDVWGRGQQSKLDANYQKQ